MDNNYAEQAIRPFTIGRKNFVLIESDNGAKASAVLYSLVETAKAKGRSPLKYITYILKDMSGSEFLQYPEHLDDFMPWNPEIIESCK